MKNSKAFFLVRALLVGLMFAVPALAQEKEQSKTQATTQKTSNGSTSTSVAAGRKQKISGIIAKRDGNNLIVRDRAKAEYKVSLTSTTKIQERKMNLFRGAKQYDQSSLVRGLWVEIEGQGSDSGALIANTIKFTDEQFRDASSLETRVDPVEDRVGETENRMSQAEQN